MINSRKLSDLHPKVATMAMLMIDKLKAELQIELLVTSTYRDAESQNALYAQGRSQPGKIVTRARAGESFHNYRVAFDVVPLRNGKPVWDSKDPIWTLVGSVGKQCGLEWAGDWKNFKEFPHFQYTNGLTLSDFKKGLHI